MPAQTYFPGGTPLAKILVVDDSWLIRKVVGGYLRKEGHEVVEGENGNQCLDLAELEKLASLRDQGIISDEDFEAKKKQLLGL